MIGLPSDVDIAVIGAGAAGIGAARRLREAGSVSLLVLEARDRVGGRVWNHDLGGGHISERGGTFVGPTQDPLAKEVDYDPQSAAIGALVISLPDSLSRTTRSGSLRQATKTRWFGSSSATAVAPLAS